MSLAEAAPNQVWTGAVCTFGQRVSAEGHLGRDVKMKHKVYFYKNTISMFATKNGDRLGRFVTILLYGHPHIAVTYIRTSSTTQYHPHHDVTNITFPYDSNTSQKLTKKRMMTLMILSLVKTDLIICRLKYHWVWLVDSFSWKNIKIKDVSYPCTDRCI